MKMPSYESTNNRDSRSRLSIYDDKIFEIVYLEDQPSRMEVKVEELRLKLNNKVSQLKGTLQGYINKIIGLEKKTEDLILNLVPKDEVFMPNALYTGIVAISGSLFTMNRNFLIRSLTTLSLGTISAYYFIPGTTNNIARLVLKAYQDNRQLIRDPLGTIDSLKFKDRTPGESLKIEKAISEVQSMYTTRAEPGIRAAFKRVDD